MPRRPQRSDDQGNLSYVVNGGFSRFPAVPIGWNGGQSMVSDQNARNSNGCPVGSRPWIRSVQGIGQKMGVMFPGATVRRLVSAGTGSARPISLDATTTLAASSMA